MDTETNVKLNNLTEYVGAPNDATAGTDHPSLSVRVDNLSTEIESRVYTGENGISVTPAKEIVINGLNENTESDNKIYVFKNNAASELDVANTWVDPVNE